MFGFIYLLIIIMFMSVCFDITAIKNIMHKDHEMWKSTIERYDSEFDKAKANQ